MVDDPLVDKPMYSPTSAADMPRMTMEDYDSAMTDMLMSIGVDKFSAQTLVRQLSKTPDASFMEVYGRGAIVRRANDARRSIGGKELHALDICTKKADGSP